MSYSEMYNLISKYVVAFFFHLLSLPTDYFYYGQKACHELKLLKYIALFYVILYDLFW